MGVDPGKGEQAVERQEGLDQHVVSGIAGGEALLDFAEGGAVVAQADFQGFDVDDRAEVLADQGGGARVVSRAVQPMMVNGDPYAGLGQLVWADAVFIRDLLRLDALSDRQLLTMAAVLHEAYGAVDIAFRLLAEHDRRTGGAVAARYLSGLQAPLPQAA